MGVLIIKMDVVYSDVLARQINLTSLRTILLENLQKKKFTESGFLDT